VQSRAFGNKKARSACAVRARGASAIALAVLRVRTRRVLAARAAIHRDRFRM
jgi:hypothetical protein